MERNVVRRRFLSLMLTLCMVLATLPVTPAMAAETTVSSEADLVTAVANGGTVTLGDDINLTNTLNVTKDVTLDLNGNMLTGVGDTVIAVQSGGNLTITGSTTGSITGSTGSDGGTAITVEGGNLTVSSGNVIGSNGSDGQFGSNGGAAITVKSGSLTVSGGKVIGGKGGNGNNYALSHGGNGGDGLYITSGTVTISGGEITGGNGGNGLSGYNIVGANGGAGGNALHIAGGTVTIVGSGTISGGNGGNGVSSEFGGFGGFNGNGGNGVSSTSGTVTIVSSGTISGGTAGTGGSSGTNGDDLSRSETGVIVTYSWYSANESEFTISTVSELLGFANLVNGADLPAGFPEKVTFEGKTVKLGADIDLSSIANWTPIGRDGADFRGTFDGNDKTISNLTANSTGKYDFVGLFGKINSATVKNLAVSGNVTGTGDFSRVGGVVGELCIGMIENCSFSGSVTGNGNCVGGIVGNSTGTISKCSNAATVSGSAIRIGGIAGMISKNVRYCYNQGDVTSNKNDGVARVGGIFGAIDHDSSSITVGSCYNTGTVYATSTSANVGSVGGDVTNFSDITIDDCYYLEGTADKGIGSTYLYDGASITGEAVVKSSTAFSSGELAYLLQNVVADADGLVWGQTLTGSNKDDYPVFANESGSNKVYKVTFVTDSVSTVKYLNGGTITVSNPTAPNGYTFGGWYTAQTGGTQVTDVTEDTTLYAQCKPIPANAPTVSGSGAEVTYGEYTDKKISVTVTDKDEDTYSYSYQWYDSSKNKISGATENTYTIPNDLTGGYHDYYCFVTAKRSDNSETATNEKKITVKVNKAEQSATPELVGTAETIDGKSDGKITGVTPAMEYRKAGTTDYIAITGTEVTGLAVGKYYVRYKADNNYFASADTEVTVDKGRKMTVAVPTAQVGYTLTVNKTELVWNDSIELTFALANGYSKLDTFAVNVNGNPITLDTNGKCTVNDIQSDITITVVGVADIIAPTGEIKVGADSWKEFLNNITFGLFFKDMQEVTITAMDNIDENVKIEYLLSDKELTADELAVATFNSYIGKFNIEPNNEYVIYAKLSDNSGNVTYINSTGIVLDNIAPVISGIVNGKTYCEAQTVTVSDNVGVASVTVNGTPVTPDRNGQFTLKPAEGKQTVFAKDQAGNVSAEMIVTVNDGHEGGTASCAKQAKCKHCDTYYGQLDGNNHTGYKHVEAVDSTVASRGNVEYWYCSDCGKYYSDEAGKNEIDESGIYTYTVTFNVGGGSFVADKINVKWDDAVLDGVDNPVKRDRVFEGWTCGDIQVKEDVSYGDFAKNKDVASIVLNAQWRRVSGLNAQQPTESEIEAALAKFSFMARSAKTPNNNVKVVLKTDAETEKFIKEWQDKGYVVKYQFYRSTNPKYGYKEMLNKESGTYINTVGIYGAKYYYKARVQVYDKDGKLIAQTGLKQCKYACRTWTK